MKKRSFVKTPLWLWELYWIMGIFGARNWYSALAAALLAWMPFWKNSRTITEYYPEKEDDNA